MCGIAGIYHLTTPKPVDPLRVERMCDAMVHRALSDLPGGVGGAMFAVMVAMFLLVALIAFVYVKVLGAELIRE